MNDDVMVELTAEEAARVHGGYETLLLGLFPFMWSGTFGLWAEPSYATPISIPSFS